MTTHTILYNSARGKALLRRAAHHALCLLAAMTLLCACGTQKTAVGDTNAPFTTAAHIQAMQQRESKETNLTAKLKMRLEMDGRSISTNGTLRMKKDDVVQLTLVDPILGAMEVGRMEFTKNRVLIIDRINKQYIDVPYSEVAFLQRANIDFNTLQSLFWNEIFVPGKSEVSPDDFTVETPSGTAAASAKAVCLVFTDQLLRYKFFTERPSAQLNQTRISAAKDNDDAQFAFSYADFAQFEGRPFPKQMKMSFVMGSKQASLDFTLTSMHNNSDWSARTQVPSKYTKADAEKIFQKLVK